MNKVLQKDVSEPEMNATNFYVSTCRIVLQGEADAPSTWQELYHTLPILRNSLSCTVCECLLTEPYTPEETSCEHHVCKQCRGGVKKLKPTCSWCRDYSKYFQNVTLRILIESYKKLCKFIKISKMYHHFDTNQEFGVRMKEIIAESEGVLIKPADVKEEEDSQNEEEESIDEKCDIKSEILSHECKEEILEEVVEECEVAPLELDHDNEPMDEIIGSPLAKLNQNQTYVPDSTRIIPTFSLNVKVDTMANTPKTIPLLEHPVVTSSTSAISTKSVPSVQTTPPKMLPWKPEKKLPSILSTVSPKPNGYRPLGKIKREAFILDPFKTKNDIVGKSWGDSVKKSSSIVKSENSCPSASGSSESSPDSSQCSFKQYKIKPFLKNKIKRKSGCRCGNATPCPGKLTCCGQRCPCYVDSLACMDCKCKGCRNPHRPGGGKVRPHIPQVGNMQVVYPSTKAPSGEIDRREQGDTHTLMNGESDGVSIPNILANIPVINIDTIPNGKSSTWTKSNYKAVFSSLSTVPVNPASSNGPPGGSLNGLSTMSLSGLSNGSSGSTMSLSGLSNGSSGASLRIQPLSVISVLSSGNIMAGDSPLDPSSLGGSPQVSSRTSSDSLQLIDEGDIMEESEEESSDIDIDVGM